MQIQPFWDWRVLCLCSAVCAAAGHVVVLVDQRLKQPCRLRDAGRSEQSHFVQFGLTVEDGNGEVKLYTWSGQSRYVGGGRVEPSIPSHTAAEVKGFRRARMRQPNAKPLKDPAPKPSSTHAIPDFIRLWIKTVGGFEVVIRAGNEGGGFLFPSSLV